MRDIALGRIDDSGGSNKKMTLLGADNSYDAAASTDPRSAYSGAAAVVLKTDRLGINPVVIATGGYIVPKSS